MLAANDLPSINDVTYTELLEIIAKVINLTSFSGRKEKRKTVWLRFMTQSNLEGFCS